MPAKKITFDFFLFSRRKRAQKTSEDVRSTIDISRPPCRSDLTYVQKSRILTYQSPVDLRCFALPKVLRGRDRYQKTRMEKVEYECDLENRERMSRDLQKWEKPSKIEKSAVFRP